ncbi:MAG: A/G-specific adenine glycosylase [Akkermansiaceae bacterium]
MSDPYRVLISEVMLQQTQIATVLGKGYYTKFLEKFPNVESLAEADDESLLKAWEGLGYYRRVRMLRETARHVVSEYGGKFPEAESSLLSLPGIGPYTAAALRAFSFKKRSNLVDGNVSRVLARILNDPAPVDATSTIREHRRHAYDLCDPGQPDLHHHAMMEIGQQICRPGLPHCLDCPISKYCECQEPSMLPQKKPRVGVTKIEENAIFVRNQRGEILLQKEMGKRRSGLWKLPLRSSEFCSDFERVYESTYQITRYRVLLRVFQLDGIDVDSLEVGEKWIPRDRVEILPFAAPFRKAIDILCADL